jgi:hypothetical protein
LTTFEDQAAAVEETTSGARTGFLIGQTFVWRGWKDLRPLKPFLLRQKLRVRAIVRRVRVFAQFVIGAQRGQFQFLLAI